MSVSYTITLSDAQNKALAYAAVSPQEWIENAVAVRCQHAIDEIVKAEIERKLEAGETISGSKDDIVLAANVETAAEKNERFIEQSASIASNE